MTPGRSPRRISEHHVKHRLLCEFFGIRRSIDIEGVGLSGFAAEGVRRQRLRSGACELDDAMPR